MSTDYVEHTTVLIRRLTGHQLIPHAIRLLADGEPVTLEQLATSSGWAIDEIHAALDAPTNGLAAERDQDGRLVGIALSLRPTPIRYTTNGRTFYAWCASDTLMLPAILGQPASVESTCPETGQAIRIELTPDSVERIEPPTAVMTAVRPGGQLTNVRAQTCQHGHFYSSRTATSAWATAHPDGHIYPLEEAFERDREVIRQLGWDTATQPAAR